MESNNGRLVSFRTKENYEIIGMLYSNSERPSEKIVIHIHGNFGNFYQNKFIWIMSYLYIDHGIDFLAINLSSHDGLAEGYYGKDLKYVGGAVADYSDSQKDIDAAIEFVKQRGYKTIILQGHSLGCDKIIQHSLNNNSIYPLILLSPVDSYKVQSEWIYPETVENQIKRLSRSVKEPSTAWGKADFDWIPSREYGAKGDTADWTYEIPISRPALLSILKSSAFKYLNVMSGSPFIIKCPVFVFVGARDGLQMHENKTWITFLEKSFPNSQIVSHLDADHDVCGVEEEVSELIIQWIMTF